MTELIKVVVENHGSTSKLILWEGGLVAEDDWRSSARMVKTSFNYLNQQRLQFFGLTHSGNL
jgi:hypothetical protein